VLYGWTGSPEREVLLEIKQLVALRKRLLDAKNALKVPLGELAGFQNKKLLKELEKLNKKTCWGSGKANCRDWEKDQEPVKKDEVLKNLFALVTSVDGVGEAAAALLSFGRLSPLLMSLSSLVVPESLPATQAYLPLSILQERALGPGRPMLST
jgi:hypothetical protein